MKIEFFKTAKARPRRRLDLPGLLILLLCVTMLSVCLASRMLARFTGGDSSQDGARVAKGGSVAVLEYKATYNEALARYDMDQHTLVSSNIYEMIVPGMTISKTPFVRLIGDNDVTCVLYIEVKPSEDDLVDFDINDGWVAVTDESEFPPPHGGVVYRYDQDIAPHQSDTLYIIEDNHIYIHDDFKDKNDPAYHGDPFRVDLYAYLVQKD